MNTPGTLSVCAETLIKGILAWQLGAAHTRGVNELPRAVGQPAISWPEDCRRKVASKLTLCLLSPSWNAGARHCMCALHIFFIQSADQMWTLSLQSRLEWLFFQRYFLLYFHEI
jgi:hypothetical protein